MEIAIVDSSARSEREAWHSFKQLEIRETNIEAQLFFSHRGFRAVRVLRKHYDETGEDGYLFRYTLPVATRRNDGGNRISAYDSP